MAQRRKSLEQLVRDGTFVSRRPQHRSLLADSDDLPWPAFVALQRRYRATDDDFTRRGVAREFEDAVHAAQQEFTRRRGGPSIQEAMDALGPPGSAEQLIAFFPRYLCHEDGAPFHLEPWQQELLREAHALDERGERIYKEITFGGPKGVGKTPIATGQSLWTLLTAEHRPKLFQAAGSGDQAKIGVDFAGMWIAENDSLGEWLKAGAKGVSRRDSLGSYSIMPASGGLAHGRKPAAGFYDELSVFTTRAQVETYTALETALHKRRDSFIFGATNAGWDKQGFLGQLYDSALQLPEVEHRNEGFLTIARDRDAGRLFWWYGMPDGFELDLEDDVAVMRALRLTNPGSWIDLNELLRALRRTRDPYEWMRLNLNFWTQAMGIWDPARMWDALRSDEPEPPAGTRVYVGVDAAREHDTTACGWAWRGEDGRTHHRTHVWSVRADAPGHDGVVPRPLDNEGLVEPFIHALRDERGYLVEMVRFDPRFFGTEAGHLGDAGFDIAPLYQHGNEWGDAVQRFYDDALDGKIAHNGDPILAAHLKATVGKKYSGGWKIDNVTNSRPIDATDTAIMAHWAAHLGAGGNVYDDGDLLTV